MPPFLRNCSPASAPRSWHAATSHRSQACAGVAAARTENIGSPALKLRFPRRDLIGVDVELLGKLSQCSIALDGGKRHLRLTWGGSGQGGRIRVTSADLQHLFGIRGLSPIA